MVLKKPAGSAGFFLLERSAKKYPEDKKTVVAAGMILFHNEDIAHRNVHTGSLLLRKMQSMQDHF